MREAEINLNRKEVKTMKTIRALLAVLLLMGALGLSPRPVLSEDKETFIETNVDNLYRGD